ncbi:hypothetical protein [Rhodovulum sp.]|uniref:hypothetical protein n=1 Tax=Rhodovulum sp. TaxID=34009 RepID=UPI0017C838C9|nr:hypothetical protein [Rhodovulum sp.]HDR28589.1 hypothetical protein [Rhodovulum sp.]
MAYSLLLLVGQWIVTGAEGRVGSFVVLPEAALWPDRAATLGVFGILIPGVVARKLAAASRHHVVRLAADSRIRIRSRNRGRIRSRSPNRTPSRSRLARHSRDGSRARLKAPRSRWALSGRSR